VNIEKCFITIACLTLFIANHQGTFVIVCINYWACSNVCFWRILPGTVCRSSWF